MMKAYSLNRKICNAYIPGVAQTFSRWNETCSSHFSSKKIFWILIWRSELYIYALAFVIAESSFNRLDTNKKNYSEMMWWGLFVTWTYVWGFDGLSWWPAKELNAVFHVWTYLLRLKWTNTGVNSALVTRHQRTKSLQVGFKNTVLSVKKLFFLVYLSNFWMHNSKSRFEATGFGLYDNF